MGVPSLGWEDTLEVGHGNSLQYSCLEHAMDRGAWWATVHGVAERHNLVTKQNQGQPQDRLPLHLESFECASPQVLPGARRLASWPGRGRPWRPDPSLRHISSTPLLLQSPSPRSCDLSGQGHVCLGLRDSSGWHRSELSPWVRMLPGRCARFTSWLTAGPGGRWACIVFCCDPCAFSRRAVLMCVHLPQVCVCVSVFVTEKGFHESQRTFLPVRHKYSLA